MVGDVQVNSGRCTGCVWRTHSLIMRDVSVYFLLLFVHFYLCTRVGDCGNVYPWTGNLVIMRLICVIYAQRRFLNKHLRHFHDVPHISFIPSLVTKRYVSCIFHTSNNLSVSQQKSGTRSGKCTSYSCGYVLPAGYVGNQGSKLVVNHAKDAHGITRCLGIFCFLVWSLFNFLREVNTVFLKKKSVVETYFFLF